MSGATSRVLSSSRRFVPRTTSEVHGYGLPGSHGSQGSPEEEGRGPSARNEKEKTVIWNFRCKVSRTVQNEILKAALEVQQEEEESRTPRTWRRARIAPIVRLAKQYPGAGHQEKAPATFTLSRHGGRRVLRLRIDGVLYVERTSFQKRSSCAASTLQDPLPDWILPSAGCLRMDASRSKIEKPEHRFSRVNGPCEIRRKKIVMRIRIRALT